MPTAFVLVVSVIVSGIYIGRMMADFVAVILQLWSF